MKLLIAVDMEGISGVVNWQQVDPNHPEYQRFRRIMTDDVKAAIRGARRAGVEAIVVSDGHDLKTNLLIEEMPSGVRVNCGTPSPFGMVEGIDKGVDAALFIGYHARQGTQNAILAHTWSQEKVCNVWVNDRITGEIGINASVCGHFGVPVLMISGDAAACQEAAEWIHGIRTVVVKVGTAYTAAECIPPEESQGMIEEVTFQAVQDFIEGHAPAALSTQVPVKVTLEFNLPGRADNPTLTNRATRLDGRKVEICAETMASAYQAFREVVTLGMS